MHTLGALFLFSYQNTYTRSLFLVFLSGYILSEPCSCFLIRIHTLGALSLFSYQDTYSRSLVFVFFSGCRGSEQQLCITFLDEHYPIVYEHRPFQGVCSGKVGFSGSVKMDIYAGNRGTRIQLGSYVAFDTDSRPLILERLMGMKVIILPGTL